MLLDAPSAEVIDLALQVPDLVAQRAQLTDLTPVAFALPFARVDEVSTGHQHFLQEAAPSGW
ncbi:hypothetical protein A9J40_01620 [Stenotrophomonas maltophilia]|nr:hypothetical protein A9J40_01620 [Stenotrophomonas maltophilia]